MITRIEIGYKPEIRDARGEAVAAMVDGYMKIPVERVRALEVYKIDGELGSGEKELAVKGFMDPVMQDAALGKLDRGPYDWSITVGYRPGVTDNVGRTARVTLEDVLGRNLEPEAQVYTERRYLFKAPGLTRDDAERIAFGCLANLLIERVQVDSFQEFEEAPIDLALPNVTGQVEAKVKYMDLKISDEELVALSRDMGLSLNLEEMCAIRDHFKGRGARNSGCADPEADGPTETELEVLAQTWSEHCKHKIFNATIRYQEPDRPAETIHSLFKTCIQQSTREIGERVDFLVSVFHDNAGAIRFNDRWNLVYKVETHNSPSALDPYGGAMTGIVGVNRDPFGTGRGAALLANVWGYCLGSPFHDKKLPGRLLHPRRIRDGVHQGVIDGGNQSGIPYMRGFEWFDRRYVGKPLVYCGTLGLMPVELGGEPAHEKVVKPGDRVVMVGGRIGKDGIHGATFSSEELHDKSPVSAVQIGDPITQKKMTDFLLEARDRLLYKSITDNGAGGLSSSVGEMATLCGGCEMDLEKAPLKYQGLKPWEILLSEAQERMTLAISPDKLEAFLALAVARDVEATVLGDFTDSGRFLVYYGSLKVADMEMDFLHDGCPTLSLEAEWKAPVFDLPAEPFPQDLTEALEAVLCRLNVCSREEKSRQYDHEVKGLNVIKPFVGIQNDVPADATVMMAEHGSCEGVVMAEGINPRFSDLDTYWMAASIIDLTLRRLVAAGAELGTIAGLDNFCWPDPVVSEKTPDGKYKLAQLVRACKGLYDFTRAYDMPCISGKDSMKNDAQIGGVKISIPPTLLFSGVGKISDVGKAMTMDAKCAGDLVYVAGLTCDELGGSEYLAMLGERDSDSPCLGGRIPRVDAAPAMDLYRALSRAIHEEKVHSVHTPSLGGVAVGFAMKAMAGELGLEVDLANLPRDSSVSSNGIALFSESNARFIVTVDPGAAAEFEAIMEKLPVARVGRVTSEPRLKIKGLDGKSVVDGDIFDLKKKWKTVLQGI